MSLKYFLSPRLPANLGVNVAHPLPQATAKLTQALRSEGGVRLGRNDPAGGEVPASAYANPSRPY